MTEDLPLEEGVLVLRVSAIRPWLQCPRRFYFEVVKQLYPQPNTPAEEAAADAEWEIDEEHVVVPRKARRRDEGTMVHAVAEAYYRGELDGWEFDAAGHIQQVDAVVDAKAAEISTDIDEESWVTARRYAKAAARGFVPWLEFEGEDVGRTVLHVEERFHTDLAWPGRDGINFDTLRLTGKMDAVQEDDASKDVYIGDTKQVQSIKLTPRVNDYQLLAYAWLYGRETGRHVVGGYHNMVQRSLQTAKAKGPFYRRAPISVTPDKLAAFESNLRVALGDIARWVDQLDLGRSPENLRYSETQMCGWMCKTQLICDAMSSGQIGGWQRVANEYYGGTFEEVFDD